MRVFHRPPAACTNSRWRLTVLALVGAAALCAVPARAGLLEDDEARKAIIDLRQKVTQNDDAARKREADLLAQIQQLTEQVQKGLLDLNNQNEQQRAEIARLRSQVEQLAHDLSETQRKEKDLVQGVDDRLSKVEPRKVTQDGKEFMAEPDEKASFDDSIGLLRGGDFDKAATQIDAFLRRWPASGYADSARFWLGNALYGKRDYKNAITTFRAFIAAAPDHPRAPEALLAVANCQVEMKDTKAARKTLADVSAKYPQSEAAQAARERLSSLK
jgi:tol-pal system protein YbgF